MCHYTRSFTLICTSGYCTLYNSEYVYSHICTITIVYILHNANIFTRTTQYSINRYNIYKHYSISCRVWRKPEYSDTVSHFYCRVQEAIYTMHFYLHISIQFHKAYNGSLILQTLHNKRSTGNIVANSSKRAGLS